MRAVVVMGLAVALVAGLGAGGAHHNPSAPYEATFSPSPSVPAVSIPPPSGPVLIAVPLAGTDTRAPVAADALAALEAGVEATTRQPVDARRVELVASSTDTLTCLVGVNPPGSAPLLASARRVGDRWSLEGLQ